ncbi:hypothetical protein P5654_014235 [Bacillus safensis]|uniref:hypothetical protein n=1 Tax=Bacillus safensis TaxID=561879 RepID=UPI002481BDEA|nr:hypothetical protein [Bacillus safensis]MDI0190890.1 hypothetical protein [Bacillus safensis]
MEFTVPVGTIVESSSGGAGASGERYTIDGNEDLNNFWFTNVSYGSLTLMFPRAVSIAGVKFAARSWLESDYFIVEVFARLSDGSWMPINSPVDVYVSGFHSGVHRTDTVWVRSGQYDVIKIDHRQRIDTNKVFCVNEIYLVSN